MKTTVTSRHFKASEKLKDYASGEVGNLGRYIDNIVDCDIVLSYDVRQNKTVEVSVHVKGDTLVASDTSDNFYKSVDKSVAKLQKQAQKLKEKQLVRH
ncbi:MAG: ribosome-associated translation inhibitor RaiA [Calditrichaeota bacterium]|nr:ribosome-associated translation inhibitor RaiA [Candidatus Cloacimonadota bacterium]MCA9786559.1 ribosome-associated translation inhibitor RaiA [Candidatus Cloacimonadota bacterium]MCB1046284.1 ribosome-associated translation inhibitor RaiA [Calditrichota bacterium]MCB9474280.1 ribosome-associated translation inhibitor RaiA [Candidatus Delongbacteria bacterium]